MREAERWWSAMDLVDWRSSGLACGSPCVAVPVAAMLAMLSSAEGAVGLVALVATALGAHR